MDMVFDDNSRDHLSTEMKRLCGKLRKLEKAREMKVKSLKGLESMLAVYRDKPEFTNKEARRGERGRGCVRPPPLAAA